MSNGLLDWWLVHPKEWHASPFASVGLFAGTVILIFVAAIVFWIKGRFWP